MRFLKLKSLNDVATMWVHDRALSPIHIHAFWHYVGTHDRSLYEPPACNLRVS